MEILSKNIFLPFDSVFVAFKASGEKQTINRKSFLIILETQFSIWRTILYKHRRSSQFTFERDSDSSKWIIERIFGKLSRRTTLFNRIVLLCKWSFPDSELVELLGSWWIDVRWRVCNLLRISGFSLKLVQSCAVINRLKVSTEIFYRNFRRLSDEVNETTKLIESSSKSEIRRFIVKVCKLKFR